MSCRGTKLFTALLLTHETTTGAPKPAKKQQCLSVLHLKTFFTGETRARGAGRQGGCVLLLLWSTQACQEETRAVLKIVFHCYFSQAKQEQEEQADREAACCSCFGPPKPARKKQQQSPQTFTPPEQQQGMLDFVAGPEKVSH